MLKRFLSLSLLALLALAQPVNANWWAMQQSGYGGGACDSNTVLMIHSDSTNDSAVFQDSSNDPSAITANGNTHHETDNNHAGFGATTIYFDGTNDDLQIAASDSKWAFGTGDFTIDFWIRRSADAASMVVYNGYAADNLWAVRKNITSSLVFTYSAAGSVTSTGTLAVNTWTHVAIERFSGTLAFYFNGVKDATTGNLAAIDFSGLADLMIGGHAVEGDFTGYLDEIRISNVARYGGNNFTPESGPYCQ